MLGTVGKASKRELETVNSVVFQIQHGSDAYNVAFTQEELDAMAIYKMAPGLGINQDINELVRFINPKIELEPPDIPLYLNIARVAMQASPHEAEMDVDFLSMHWELVQASTLTFARIGLWSLKNQKVRDSQFASSWIAKPLGVT